MKDVTVRRRKLSEYQRDPANANAGTVRGAKVIAESLEESGPGRSLVADKHDVLVAGNQVAKAAEAAGLEEVIEIRTKGDALIVHVREDFDLADESDGKARRYALADNRAQELSLQWDADQLERGWSKGLLKGLFREDEYEALLQEAGETEAVESALSSPTPKLSGERSKQIKPVLYAEDIATFEQAILMTGLTNRGEALIAICSAFLDGFE